MRTRCLTAIRPDNLRTQSLSVTKDNKIQSPTEDLTSANSHSRSDTTLWAQHESASSKFVLHKHNSLLNFRGKSLQIKLRQKYLNSITLRRFCKTELHVHLESGTAMCTGRCHSIPTITILAMTGNLIWTQMYVTLLPPSALLVKVKVKQPLLQAYGA